MKRRQFLIALGTTTMATLAGCSMSNQDGDETETGMPPDDTPLATNDSETMTTATTTSTPPQTLTPTYPSLQTTELAPNDGSRATAFGKEVELSGDGTIAVIGVWSVTPAGAGSAYVFSRSGEGWSQQTKLAPVDGNSIDNFGISVAVSNDGTTAIIGSTHSGDVREEQAESAYVFSQSDEGWSQQAKLLSDDGDRIDLFGASAATSDDGTTAIIGSIHDTNPNGEKAGSAYVFSQSDEGWSQQAKLLPDDGDRMDQFGNDVGLSADSTIAIISSAHDTNANGEKAGSVYVFSQSSGRWRQQTKLLPDDGDDQDGFGVSATVSGDGTTAVVGATGDGDPNRENAGAAYVFSRSGGGWSQQAKLLPDDGDRMDFFGKSVAVSGEGTTAIVSSLNDEDPIDKSDEPPMMGVGSAYVFSQSDEGWSQRVKLSLDDGDSLDQFGYDVELSDDGTTALVGNPSPGRLGNAYVFE